MLGLQVFDTPGGDLLADWSGQAREVTFETGEHGFASLSAVVALPIVKAFEIYSGRVVPHLVLSDGAAVAWEGRVEDVAITNEGLRVGALGYWRALRDLPYTALWQDTSTARWETLTSDDVGEALPARFEGDNNNRLYLAPMKDETFGSATAWGMWGYQIPHRSARQIVSVSFDYVLVAPSGWRATLTRRDDDWGALSSVWTLDGNGATQSGSQALSVSACDGLAFTLFYNDAAAAYTGETGGAYLRITSLKVKTTTSASLTADEIATALAAFVSGVNVTQLDDGAGWIEIPGVDLGDELYEDADPAEVLTRLAAIGDDQTPPRRWEVGVWEGRRLHLRPRGQYGRTWYVDIADLTLERTLDSLTNSAYALYSSGGRRTATVDDSDSVAVNGLTRRGYVRAETSSATLAETQRDAFLDDAAGGRPRAEIATRGIYDASGARWPRWAARAHDTVVVRNLPPDLGELDHVRRFTLAGTRYEVDGDRLTLIPAELPSLAFLVAQREK